MASPFGVGGNVFGGKTNAQPDSKEFSEFVKQLSGEMTQWERSGQWQFSSFTPLKAHPMLAGFSDVSPEELRTQAYEALKNNTSSSYQDRWRKLQEQYKQLRDALRVPTPDAYQAMKDVFHAKGTSTDQQPNQSSSSQAVKPTSLFSKPSIFGGNASQTQSGSGPLDTKPQSSVFGGSSLFGGNQTSGTTSLFGDSSKTNVFGGSSSQGSQPSFGASQSSVSTFGNTSLFKSNTANTGNVFGGPANIQGTSLFGGSPTQPARNIFGSSSLASTTGGSIFGGGTASIATTSTTGSIFGGGSTTITTTTGGIFGVSSAPTNAPNTAAGLFGSAPNQTSTIFSNNSQNQPSTFASTTTNLFGTSTNLFASKPAIFGGQQGQQQQQSTTLFGNNPVSAPSIFGGAATTQGSQPQQSTAPSVFGTSIFGTGSGVATQSGGGSGLFGGASNTSSTQTNVFGNTSQMTSSMGLFGKPADSQQQTLQLSSAHQTVPSLFGGGASNTNPSLFGGGVGHTNTKLLGTNNRAENYTPLDQLSDADREQFDREDFLYIPICPPPIELC
ncbi:hypothetical protein SK128_003969 [Halocaridina rubra]|uniref:Uncharacterized protein n=1 Tax=Halocaridina rubra TaxID=373956 RepID=A0AAN8WXE6_HALRR